jgi:UDP-N-acetylmuramoyl-L-alanyl-D-glutamate--2,6-diaminopimelate ligase
MHLRELLASTPVYELIGFGKMEVTGISIDPQEVEKGYLYIYCPDSSQLPYEEAIRCAVERGATAICIGREYEVIPYDVTFIVTYHVNRFISAVTRNFYRNPSQSMKLVGITGSHGKSTIGWMIKSILDASETSGVIIGAFYCKMGNQPYRTYENAIHPLTLNALLRQAIQQEIHLGVVECSYTAIVHEMLRHIWFDSIIYTDLYTYFQNQKTDYHYVEIRKTLMDHLKHVKSPVIVNMDDYYANQFKRDTVIGYGICNCHYVNAKDIQLSPHGSSFTITTPEGDCEIILKVPGIHNVYNALATVAWGLVEGMSLEYIKRGLMLFENSKDIDKMDRFDENVRIHVESITGVHSLEEVYLQLKVETSGKLVTILPVGGDFEVSEYQDIGQTVDRYSDHCIITLDYSSLQGSMDKAFGVAQQMGDTVIGHEMDYYKALQKAIDSAGEGGCVLVLSQMYPNSV